MFLIFIDMFHYCRFFNLIDHICSMFLRLSFHVFQLFSLFVLCTSFYINRVSHILQVLKFLVMYILRFGILLTVFCTCYILFLCHVFLWLLIFDLLLLVCIAVLMCLQCYFHNLCLLLCLPEFLNFFVLF